MSVNLLTFAVKRPVTGNYMVVGYCTFSDKWCTHGVAYK